MSADEKAVILMEMQLRVEWTRLENAAAERENALGGWLSDHGGAVAQYSAEFDELKKRLLGDVAHIAISKIHTP